MIRNYLDVCLELPWGKKTRERVSVEAARKVLDKDHYGLEKVKERILEFLAVKQLAPELKGQVICLVGPPGVGKTSIAMSMARAMNPNSAGSQFFIMVDEAPHLDGEYAAFGKVTEGMDVADAIVNQARDRMDRPRAEQRIKAVTVETFGVDYPAPEKV